MNNNRKFAVYLGCEGPDSNRRTPTGLGPKPSAFDLAWQPSLILKSVK